MDARNVPQPRQPGRDPILAGRNGLTITKPVLIPHKLASRLAPPNILDERSASYNLLGGSEGGCPHPSPRAQQGERFLALLVLSHPRPHVGALNIVKLSYGAQPPNFWGFLFIYH